MVNVIAIILLIGGAFFLAVGSLGVVRLPDFFSRMHAAGKCDTLGVILSMGGLIVYHGLALDSFKLLMILIFIGLANPTATHAMARAALRSGLKPWVRREGRVGS